MKKNIILFFLYLSAIASAQDRSEGPEILEIKKLNIQQATTLSGQITAWANNDDFVYDGFYMQVNQEKFLVLFPTYLGSQLTKSIKLGNTITVNGVSSISEPGEKRIRMTNITVGKKTIYSSLFMTQRSISREEFISNVGKISEQQKNKQGDIKGLVVDGKTVLRLPSPMASQLNHIAEIGTMISYTGTKNILQPGEVAAENYTIIHCQTFTINGIQYLTR